MPYEIGDTEPPHIDVHNELNAQVAELSARSGIEVVLPPLVSLGDTGHVNDHNLYTVAIQKIAVMPTRTLRMSISLKSYLRWLRFPHEII